MAANPDINVIAEQIEARAEREAIALLASSTRIPKIPGWSWVPFLTALGLQGRLIDTDPNDVDLDDDWPTSPDAKGELGSIKSPSPPSGAPPSDNHDFVWYVPLWSHPDYTDRIVQEYDGRNYLRGTSDPATRLRPALRPEDAIKAPTEYAKRFGIHPDELGGRSHFSPTITPTRNPLDDYATQCDMLTDVEKQQVIDETRKRGLGNAADPNHIDPGVLSDFLANNGVLTGFQFQTDIDPMLGVSSLEQLVDNIKQYNPNTAAANRNYLDGALRDQDYQRLFFHELTTDELIKHNIHTMSNLETSNLTGPLHP